MKEHLQHLRLFGCQRPSRKGRRWWMGCVAASEILTKYLRPAIWPDPKCLSPIEGGGPCRVAPIVFTYERRKSNEHNLTNSRQAPRLLPRSPVRQVFVTC